ncbi:hypothetical protein GQ55_8G104900 [Panicum hallii var. hallii]|uniref:Uncharacterized protein n=2 Tax=Panicum hallii TaxID=206008 RepID=A0A2T7CMC8_9POAL|nr:hypothetical protein GQ55_8G104900 [Panicum hallii var. hallii]PVH33935.1 hypothetical protein PAHAL_8G105000 [Panicum hallii]
MHVAGFRSLLQHKVFFWLLAGGDRLAEHKGKQRRACVPLFQFSKGVLVPLSDSDCNASPCSLSAVSNVQVLGTINYSDICLW